MITEAEAKTKWCPLVRLGTTQARLGDGAFNRILGEEPLELLPTVRCIGSACMAWRWTGYSREKERTGYCGAFGPEHQ